LLFTTKRCVASRRRDSGESTFRSKTSGTPSSAALLPKPRIVPTTCYGSQRELSLARVVSFGWPSASPFWSMLRRFGMARFLSRPVSPCECWYQLSSGLW
jgi:hypothetical protein